MNLSPGIIVFREKVFDMYSNKILHVSAFANPGLSYRSELYDQDDDKKRHLQFIALNLMTWK